MATTRKTRKPKGFLITFEGGEGVGKSTQIRLLTRFLGRRRIPYEVTRQPGGTKIGVGIRRLVLHPSVGKISPRAELLLYEADRAHHTDNVIVPALQSGKIVISDRFADSSTVYQGICRGLGRKWTQTLNDFATDGLAPDLVFLIDLPVEEGRKRLTARKALDKIELEKLVFHKRVRSGFLSLARQFPKRFVTLDGRKSKETIARTIQLVVENRLHRRGLLK